MSELGRLTPSAPNDLSYLSGHVATLDGRIEIAIEGDPTCCDEHRPSHRITTRARDGSPIVIGVAWLKTARHGLQKGKQFFTVQIDYPERSGPLNAAAFRDEKNDEWVIVWRRRGVQLPGAVATSS